MSDQYKYDPPTDPIFICGGGELDIEFTSEERDRFIALERHRRAGEYHARHGEYPDFDTQAQYMEDAAEVYDRRVAMKQSVTPTPPHQEPPHG